jgi:hypothetical protein
MKRVAGAWWVIVGEVQEEFSPAPPQYHDTDAPRGTD